MKITKIICLFAIAAFSISCKKEIKANKAFIESVAKYYSEQTSLSADVEYKIKFFDNEDTTTVKTQVKLIRDIKDTIYGGIVWYKAHIDSTYKNIEKYYDGDKIYVTRKDSLSLTRFNAKIGETFTIDGATDGEAKNIFFFKPDKLANLLTDATLKTTISDTMFDDQSYALLSVEYPDDEETTGSVKKIYINKENKLIEKITYFTMMGDQFQYNEWNISKIEFNTVKKQNLDKHLKETTVNFKVTDYKPLTEEQMAPLTTGTMAPDFKAKLYKDNKEVKLSDYKGKIVVLDFWYMSCYPCQMAIPHLNSVQEKYKDKVVVLGVNASDTDEKQIKKIPDFIKRNNLGYDIAMIERNVVKQYNIHAFPTLYVIDPKGIIKYAQRGFSEELEKSLNKIIKDN